MSKYSHKLMGKMAGWAAKQVGLEVIDMTGLKLVDADTALMPKGCRPIPLHFYDVDPAVLNQLKDGNRAILHQAMKNWQVSNEQTNKHWFLNGDQWGTKSDPKTWHKSVFPFLTLRTVKAMIADLAEASLLIIDGAWCQPIKAEFSGVEQLALTFGKDFQQPRKIFPSSIQSKSNSSKIKTSKQTPIRVRKDAVADFHLPETRNSADAEMHEHHDGDVEGRDVLLELPGELVSQWTNNKLSLEELVARHGVDRINNAWDKAVGFKSRIAGAVTLLAKAPSPSSAPPPSPTSAKNAQLEYVHHEGEHPLFKLLAGPDDDTEPDLVEVPGNETPAIDVPVVGSNEWHWIIAYGQLEIQLDRASFETWLRGATYSCIDNGVWVIRVANAYARDMLQHRLYREIRRVLSDVVGVKHDQIELRFEVQEAIK